MLKRVLLVGLAALLLVCPAGLQAQGVAIDHSAVGCLVAEKFPKLQACFSPMEQVARARVYFRADGGPYWYFVDMHLPTPAEAKEMKASGVPCYQGILPKPKKTIPKINYYVEAVDKGFAEARTAEYAPIVVPDAGGCKKDTPAAPFVQNASVTVGGAAGAPVVPAGFAAAGVAGVGGTSAVVVVATVAGAGAATAVVATSTGSSGGSATTTTTLGGGSTTTTLAPPPTRPTPPPTTTPTNKANLPPNAVFVVSPDPPSGLAPLPVRFDMCATRDPDGDPLTFSYTFGDGQTDSGGCRTTHLYSTPTLQAQSVGGVLTATVSVADDHGHEVSKSYQVSVGCPKPTVKITSPANGSNVDIGCNFDVDVTANAADAFGIAKVDFYSEFAGQPGRARASAFDLFATDTTSPYGATLDLFCCFGTMNVQAIATNACGATSSHTISFDYFTNCGKPDAGASLGFTSQLDVKGARGQVVVNGAGTSSHAEGKTLGLAQTRKGENRVEAQLVEAAGSGGTWRFDLTSSGAFESGSLRVVAGQVVEISERAVVFRIQGRTGERVGFTFQSR